MFRRTLFHAAVTPLLALVLTVGAAFGQPAIQTRINGRPLTFSQPPVVRQGRVLVPLRGIFQSLGANVFYDPATRTIRATRGQTVVQLALGSRQATVNGSTSSLDVPAQTIAGRTMVPLRFVSQALGANVRWMPSTRTVAIESSQTPAVAANTQVESPQIYSLHHNALTTLHDGDTLIVTMTGDPNGEATFDILGSASNVPMQETSPGHYQGELMIGPGMSVSQGTLVGRLRLNGQVAVRDAARRVSIRAIGEGTSRVGLASQTPQPGETVSNHRPRVAAAFRRPVRRDSIRLLLDGQDVTPESSITSREVSYLPGDRLAPGRHFVHVRAVGRNGAVVNRRWSFHVGHGTTGYYNGAPGLVVTNLTADQRVPGVFEVRGRTAPYATVKVSARPTRTVLPGVLRLSGRPILASQVADARGRFHIRLDVSSLPRHTRLHLRVRATGRNGNLAQPEEIELVRR